jgi:eukaryotic-like serine/threonine-protein kinase
MLIPSGHPSLQIGSTLGGFRLISRLGKGAMGFVFLAEDVKLGRRVAVKVMQPHLAEDPKAKERFLREAQAAALVEHDRIVRIYQVDEDRGVPFIAMEKLEGTDLDSHLRDEPIPSLKLTVKVALQTAQGLAAAHRKGLIHRDVKPSNLWLESLAEKGGFRVKILDFGLAKATTGDDLLTQSREAPGTPRYMAPEQWRSADQVDHRSDLFSLGIVLYQMTTGSFPFHGKDQYQLMFAVNQDIPPPPKQVNPKVPRVMSDLIMLLLEKDKNKRPQSSDELVAILEAMTRVRPGGPASAAGSASDLFRPLRTPKNEMPFPPVTSLEESSGPTFVTTATSRPMMLDCTAERGASGRKAKAAQTAWSDYLGLDAETSIDLGGGAKISFVLIPPGMFWMGTSADQVEETLRNDFSVATKPMWLADEQPQHLVKITKPFYLGKYPVTQGEYERLMGTNPAHFQGERVNHIDSLRFPVEKVSWKDVKMFCVALSKLSRPKGFGELRLPTEAEWEYACRSGSVTAFPFGDLLNGTEANCNGQQPFGTPASGPNLGRPSAVGAYMSNNFGLFDMVGNVWEWCEDGYEERAYDLHETADPLIAFNDRLVRRGGSWDSRGRNCRSANRGRSEPFSRYVNVGFRVAIALADVKGG